MQVSEMEPSFQVGPLLLMTDTLKKSLTCEIKSWKLSYAKMLNQKSAQDMKEILTFFDSMMKRLSRPIKDLDDVRALMAAIGEIKDSEYRIDTGIIPIEEAYALLNKYNLLFNDGNAERVDSLTYGYSKLKTQVT